MRATVADVTALRAADLSGRHLERTFQIGDPDGRFAVRGLLASVHHCGGGRVRLELAIARGQVVEVDVSHTDPVVEVRT